MGARFSDSTAVARLDMAIAFAVEAQGKPNAGDKWAEVFATVDELLDAERLRLEDAALALSVALPLSLDELVEDLTQRQRARHS